MSHNRIWNMSSIFNVTTEKNLYLNFLTYSKQGNVES